MSKIIPDGYKSLFPLEKYISSSGLKPEHLDLLKIRASQINGCAYCINMHTKEARSRGETETRIYMLQQWKEVDLFNEEEKALLALTEEVTLISNHLSDQTYKKALEIFGESYLANLIMAIVAINAWNRIGVATLLKPEY
ncbi:carboxymuconolactone decarboxylase family protein [Pedobacter sp. UYP24]